MKRSDEIKKQIEKLEKEFIEALHEESFEIVWNSYSSVSCGGTKSDDLIGFHDIHKLRTLLSNLYDGYVLVMRHSLYGYYHVWMNPQRNRILVQKVLYDMINNDDSWTPSDEGPSEDIIISHMLSYPQIWYRVDKKFDPIYNVRMTEYR